MHMTRRRRTAYWILIALVLLPMAGSGVPELLGLGPAMTVQSHRFSLRKFARR